MNHFQAKVVNLILLEAIVNHITLPLFRRNPACWFIQESAATQFLSFLASLEAQRAEPIDSDNIELIVAEELFNLECQYSPNSRSFLELSQLEDILTQEYRDVVHPDCWGHVESTLIAFSSKNKLTEGSNHYLLGATALLTSLKISHENRVLDTDQLVAIEDALKKDHFIHKSAQVKVFPMLLSFENMQETLNSSVYCPILRGLAIDLYSNQNSHVKLLRLFENLFNQTIQLGPNQKKVTCLYKKPPVTDIEAGDFFYILFCIKISEETNTLAESVYTENPDLDYLNYSYFPQQSALKRHFGRESDCNLLLDLKYYLESQINFTSSFESIKSAIAELTSQFKTIDVSDNFTRFNSLDDILNNSSSIASEIPFWIAHLHSLNKEQIQCIPSLSAPVIGVAFIARLVLALNCFDGIIQQNCQRILDSNWESTASDFQVAQKNLALNTIPFLMVSTPTLVQECWNTSVIKHLELLVLDQIFQAGVSQLKENFEFNKMAVSLDMLKEAGYHIEVFLNESFQKKLISFDLLPLFGVVPSLTDLVNFLISQQIGSIKVIGVDQTFESSVDSGLGTPNDITTNILPFKR